MGVPVRWYDQSRSVIPADSVSLERAAERLTRAAVADLRAHPRPLYESGIYYHGDPRPNRWEQWRVPSQIRERADCKVLAAWRAAELRIAGDPGARVIVRRTGPRMWHALVEHGDGRTEDPSRVLGMDAVAGVGAGAERSYTVTWAARRHSPQEWRGEVVIALTNGDTFRARGLSQGRGASRGRALASAINTATSALDSPVLRTLLPPQAAMALSILRSRPVAQAARGALRLMRKIF